MAGMLTGDIWTTEELKYLAPYYSSFSQKGPREMSNNIAFPKPVAGTIVNWLYSEKMECDPIKQQRMREHFTFQ